MSAYPFQTIEHDASISAEHDPDDVGVVLLQVDVGVRVHIDLQLSMDDARGLAEAIAAACVEADKE